MSTSIAQDAEMWVKAAAGRTTGMTVCAQIAQAVRNLGYKDQQRWRVRAAWFGQAECWSAKALRELEARYRAFEARQASAAAEIDRTHAALLRAGAAVLETGNEAMDRRHAREMVSHAHELELSHSRYQSEGD